MEGAPQRANSAQLAARNIKAAKPRRRPAGRLGSPTPQPSSSILAPGGGSGGGLFGGSVQAPGTFDFAAPAAGLSFPPTSFGANNNPFAMNSLSSPDVSENESDPRADTTGEEAARAKRPFRGFGVSDDQSGNSLFPAAVSSNNPFGSLQTQEKPNSFPPFPSSTTQVQQTSFGFNTTAAPTQTLSNAFSFGQTPSQASNIFGVANSQPQPSNSLFNFGQSASQPVQSGKQTASSSTFNFGQAVSQAAQPEQPKSSAGLFNFGQPVSQSAQPVETEQPKPLFSFSAPAAALSEKPSTKPAFTFGQTTQTPKTIFGGSQPSEALASNLFGNSQPSTAPGSPKIFGSLSQKSAPSTNIFSNLNAPASPSGNLFGSQDKTTAGGLSEANAQQREQPVSSGINLFANSSQSTPSSNLFGELKPQPSSTSNIFGGQQQPAASSIGGSNQQHSMSTAASRDTDKPTTSQDLFGHSHKPVEPLAGATNVIADPNGTTSNELKNDEASPRNSTSSDFGQGPSTNVSNASPLTPVFSATQTTPSGTAGSPAFSFGLTQSSLQSGNSATSLNKPSTHSGANQVPASSSYPPTAHPIQGEEKTARASSQSTADTSKSAATSPRVTLSGILRRIEQTDVAELAEMIPQMADAASYPEADMRHLIPESSSDEQKEQFYLAFRLRLLNNAMASYFATAEPTTEVCPGMVFYVKMRELIVTRCPPSFRPRKGRRWLAKENQENQDPNDRSRGTKGLRPLQSQSTGRSSVSPTKSPPKATPAQPLSQGNITSAAPVPKLPKPSAAPAPSPTPQGKRKAENQLTKDDYERDEGRQPRPMKAPRSTGASGGSNTSNIFKNILDSAEKSVSAQASPQKEIMGLPQQSTEEAPRFNPFANLPVPSASKLATFTPTSALSANLFTAKPQSSASNPFQLAGAQSTSTTDVAVIKTSVPLKPPTFGSGPVNFLAQFGQQASKCKEDTEKKLMEDAKAEDMDSDEDEAEWETKYRQKRKAQLKEINEIARGKQASFQLGKGFAFGQTAKPSEEVITKDKVSSSDTEENPPMSSKSKNAGNFQNTNTLKPLFGQSFAPQSNGNSIFSSLNVSRTSISGGSVLDSHMSGKPSSLGANIFAHLSDADSGADSGKGNDGDDESTGDESDAEDDPNKENSNLEPKKRATGGILSPAEGARSVLSAAKSAPTFSFGSGSKFGGFGSASSASGTTSPGGSLFDRVTKDINGNPVRQISGEEKENTEPSTTSNIFGNLSNPFTKASDALKDKTWKPDSPIKFGSVTPNKNESDTPTVNVTAPTPTKAASPFSNLFGNTNTSKPASSLFGNPTSAGVGFNFGGPPSTTSSLFPSAAGSANTSRATSPGGTTDGDSAAETGDADVEHHEQIDLTIGGPGEENEEVLHEVRAKALNFVARSEGDTSNPWETKGVGPLRVLKHKETGATRILLRADPSGTLVLNKALLSQVNYEATGKTIKLLTAGESGKGLETWILQVKTPDIATSLAEVLEENKAS